MGAPRPKLNKSWDDAPSIAIQTFGKDPPTHPSARQLKPEECCGAAMPLAGEIAAKVKGGVPDVPAGQLWKPLGTRPGLHHFFWKQTAWWNPECFTIFVGRCD